MPVSIPVGFAECILPMRSTASAHVASVTFGVDVTAASGNYQSVCDSIVGAWNSSLGGMQDSSVTIGPAHLIVGQDGGDPIAVDGNDAVPGSTVQTSLPPNCALLCKKSTSLGGRKGRGRFYVPWLLATADVDEGGFIAPAKVLDCQTNASQFLSGLADANCPMVLLHGALTGVAGPPSQVLSLTADRQVATQRRRLGR
jgi:hypothetical protein